MGEKRIGVVKIYFNKIGVAAIDLEGVLKAGDKIHIKGHTTDFTQKVDSMQVEKETIKEAKKGTSIGIKVKDRVRPNDDVFLVK